MIFSFEKSFIFKGLKVPLSINFSILIGFLFVFLVLYQYYSFLTSILISLIFYISLLLHEIGHLYAAVSKGIKDIKKLSLHLLGATLFFNKEITDGKIEGYVALSGPLVSIFLSFFFYNLYLITSENIFNILSIINFLLVLFNLIPLYPMDGGRVLRAILLLLGFNRYKVDIFLKLITFIVSFILIGISIYYSFKEKYFEFFKYYFIGFFLLMFVIKDIVQFVKNFTFLEQKR